MQVRLYCQMVEISFSEYLVLNKTIFQLRETFINGCTVWFKPIRKIKWFFHLHKFSNNMRIFSEKSSLSLEQYWGSYKYVILEMKAFRDSILWMILSTSANIKIYWGLLIAILFYLFRWQMVLYLGITACLISGMYFVWLIMVILLLGIW